MMVSLYRSSGEPLSEQTLFQMAPDADERQPGSEEYRCIPHRSGANAGSFRRAAIPSRPPRNGEVREMVQRDLACREEPDSRSHARGNRASILRVDSPVRRWQRTHRSRDFRNALAQSVGKPTLTALAATILRHRKSYYAALQAANKSNDLTQWLTWFAEMTIEALRRKPSARQLPGLGREPIESS
jgi:hypothetical protein